MLRLLDSMGNRPRFAKTGAAEDDLRLTHRYKAVDHEARLGWWEGADFQEVPAQLEDFSQGGALLVALKLPPNTEVYLRLVQPTETEWAPVSILRSKPARKGMYRLAAEFPETCPYELFTTLRGNHLSYATDNVSPEFDSRYWR